MKQKIMAMLTAGLLVLGLAGCGAQSTAQTPPESVTAGGAGKATAAADVAELSLGVESEGGSTEAVRQKNAEAVQARRGVSHRYGSGRGGYPHRLGESE